MPTASGGSPNVHKLTVRYNLSCSLGLIPWFSAQGASLYGAQPTSFGMVPVLQGSSRLSSSSCYHRESVRKGLGIQQILPPVLTIIGQDRAAQPLLHCCHSCPDRKVSTRGKGSFLILIEHPILFQ